MVSRVDHIRVDDLRIELHESGSSDGHGPSVGVGVEDRPLERPEVGSTDHQHVAVVPLDGVERLESTPAR